MLRAYYTRLTSDDPKTRLDAARVWSVWEGSTSNLFPKPDASTKFGQDEFALAFARIEAHYFFHDSFMRSPNELLDVVGITWDAEPPRIEHVVDAFDDC